MKESFGIIETYGLVAAVIACDTALKSANVVLESVNYIRGGIVSITFRGDVGAIKACIDSGVSEANRCGVVLGSSVIPRLESQVDKIVSNSKTSHSANAMPTTSHVNKEAIKQLDNKKIEEEKRQADVKKAEDEKRQAEAKRIEEEKRLSDIKKQRESDERLKFEEEEKKLEELKKKTQELRNSEELRKAEASKKVEPPKPINNSNKHGGNSKKKGKR